MTTRFRCLPHATTALAAAALLGACAQEVGDINRVQPYALAKADFTQGEWYFRQTVSDVPPTIDGTFVGMTSEMDRIRWEITEEALIGYRSYEMVPGHSDSAAYDEDGNVIPGTMADELRDIDEYHGAPVIAYTIAGHFDIQRGYNASTGELTNVISENSTDRPWYEREYFRVEWDRPLVDSPLGYDTRPFGDTVGGDGVVDYVRSDDPSEDRMRMEYDDDGELGYMDFVSRVMQPASWLPCVYGLNSYGPGDCSPQQVEMRMSFLRVPEESDYEPITYDDEAMTKFGYFRTERYTYDRRRGSTYSGRVFLANRHNLWSNTWQRDASGNVLHDENDRPIARPFRARTPRPVVYHIAGNYPVELHDESILIAEGWDRAFRRAVWAAQTGEAEGWEAAPPMFVLCHNPVSELPLYPTDPAEAASVASACGQVGDEALVGDLRYNVLYWVNNPQPAGPLGYGPSSADPETGEIISGTAYVYGGAVDTYAESSLDLIRFANGDLSGEEIGAADYVRRAIEDRRNGALDPRGQNVAYDVSLHSRPLESDVSRFLTGEALQNLQGLRADISDGRFDTVRSGFQADTARLRAIEESGLDELAIDQEWIAGHGIDPGDDLSDDAYDYLRPIAHVIRTQRAISDSRDLSNARHCVIRPADIDDSILGLAQAFEGRTDYDEMYQEIRGLIYRAVMEHELGHTLGLRHNFAGSWDSVNYFDGYWDARREGIQIGTGDEAELVELRTITEIGDLWAVANLTEPMAEARARELQYSTIMDYSSAFNTDFGGLGKYDEAAILFAYTTGADPEDGAAPGARSNRQLQGYVETFDIDGGARELFQSFEGRTGIAWMQPLERYHYLTLVSELGNGDIQAGVDRLRERGLARYEDLLDWRDAGETVRPTEVPYMFCSDEYRSSRQYCRTWDRGADPMEQTLDYLQRYRGYYFFSNYRRDRLGWFPSDLLDRNYSRYFLEIVDTYQRWLLTVAIYSGRPDSGLDNQWTSAAFAGLNFLGEVLSTPSYGAYEMAEIPQYDPETGEELDEPLEILELASYDPTAQQEIYVPEGPGRSRYSRYDGDMGYYYFLYPETAGHFWTYLAGILAITSSEVQVQGVENLTGFGDVTYVIPPYLVFSAELDRLMNSLYMENYNAFAPLAIGEEFRYRPLVPLTMNDGTMYNPETGQKVQANELMNAEPGFDPAGIAIDTSMGFSDKIYAMLFGMASFTSNYSLRFTDQNRVFRNTGESEGVGPGYEQVAFCDPFAAGGGQCYSAIRDLDSEESSAAVQLIEQGQTLRTLWQNAVDDGDTGAADRIEYDIQNVVQDLNILRSIGSYGWLPI